MFFSQLYSYRPLGRGNEKLLVCSIPDPSFSESIRNYMNLRQENKDLRNDKQW